MLHQQRFQALLEEGEVRPCALRDRFCSGNKLAVKASYTRGKVPSSPSATRISVARYTRPECAEHALHRFALCQSWGTGRGPSGSRMVTGQTLASPRNANRHPLDPG